MLIGIECIRTVVGSRTYWRIAPVVVATSRQKAYLGAAVAIILFIISIITLPSEAS